MQATRARQVCLVCLVVFFGAIISACSASSDVNSATSSGAAATPSTATPSNFTLKARAAR